MTQPMLLVLAVVSIAVLLFLVIKVKMSAFVAMILVSMGTAIVGGLPLDKVIPALTNGMGRTLGSVAIIVGLGAMLGTMIEVSGGAEKLAKAFTAKLGEKRVIAAVTSAAFILGIPVFFDVGFLILAPIVFGFAAVTRMNPLKIGLPVAAALLAVHVVVPPHPSPVAGAATLNADAGLLTIVGIVLCIPVTLVGYAISKLLKLDSIKLLPSPATEALDHAGHLDAEHERRAPGAGMVLALILIPLGLIMIGTTGAMTVAKDTFQAQLLSFVGAPITALMVGCLLAYVLISHKQGWSLEKRSEVMDSALYAVAIIVFVTGAGGVFANVLVETGVGKAMSDALTSLGMPVLLMAYVIAVGLRVAQGSATVAILTTAGLMSSAVSTGGYSPLQVVLITCAIGFGSYAASHINDSGFWIVTRYLGLSVADGLRTWTVVTTAGSLVGFGVTGLVWLVA